MRIAIYDPVEAYALGLAGGLREPGHEVQVLDGFERWAGLTPPPDVLVVALRNGGLSAAVAAIAGGPGILALAPDPDLDVVRELWRAGIAVVAWDASIRVIASAVAAVGAGLLVAPRDLGRDVAGRVVPASGSDWLSASEREWLQLLAEGATIVDVAADAGYSERAMYRLLHGLYGRLGVSTRSEAIAWAARRGLLEPA